MLLHQYWQLNPISQRKQVEVPLHRPQALVLALRDLVQRKEALCAVSSKIWCWSKQHILYISMILRHKLAMLEFVGIQQHVFEHVHSYIQLPWFTRMYRCWCAIDLMQPWITLCMCSAGSWISQGVHWPVSLSGALRARPCCCVNILSTLHPFMYTRTVCTRLTVVNMQCVIACI